MTTEALTERVGNRHSPEEERWMVEKLEQFGGKLTPRTIRDNNLPNEYEVKFGRSLTVGGIYSWASYTVNPELRKRKLGSAKQSTGKNDPEMFKNSQYILYINKRICGFEDKDVLEKFLKDNLILAENVKVFQLLPIRVEYSVSIGS